MYCPRCSSALGDPSINFCDNCGYDLASNLVCEKCRERIEPGWVICPNCGEFIDSEGTSRSAPPVRPVSQGVQDEQNKTEVYGESSSHPTSEYADDVIQLKNHPREYESLFEKVKPAVAKEKFDRMMSRREAYELDTGYMEKLRFFASPQSIEKQEQMHKDWIPILVNEKTTRAGAEFYRANKAYFDKAFSSSKVRPANIFFWSRWKQSFSNREHITSQG